jgi:hypothetical protein
MQSTVLLEGLANKTLSKKELLQKAQANPNLIPGLIEGTASPKASILYGCGAVLMELSEKQPQQLYPYWDKFVELLDSKYRILLWNAMAVIANLTKVDIDGKFEGIFDKYYSNFNSEYMVTVANLVGNSKTIALSKPNLIPKITAELLKIENLALTPHLTSECKLVIAEAAVEAFDGFFDKVEDKGAVVAFVRRQLGSSRASLVRQAQGFLSRWG